MIPRPTIPIPITRRLSALDHVAKELDPPQTHHHPAITRAHAATHHRPRRLGAVPGHNLRRARARAATAPCPRAPPTAAGVPATSAARRAVRPADADEREAVARVRPRARRRLGDVRDELDPRRGRRRVHGRIWGGVVRLLRRGEERPDQPREGRVRLLRRKGGVSGRRALCCVYERVCARWRGGGVAPAPAPWVTASAACEAARLAGVGRACCRAGESRDKAAPAEQLVEFGQAVIKR
ncbi:hypothetical protein CC85DRAFT_12652 [Cutaneotrichosporon oleaginosum]|uniref:Uncharacterized protein n=1 Tax=Cutaneotrichosporon oleaginosum TaxID=879819 RepID=A0A0J0XCS2_9TREE|nr:uncharacterized protein CC85DRAFT_12652 [Cutaneotrichosporon oleaginosum]KLT38862.1 hypothetical protein CC85DRAFT_12652 [Cutaneotrichosporon oleaginosum]TXT14295.1 hypothetical protein COLE_00488 [Cutaneotrichosporon oleaginosum]